MIVLAGNFFLRLAIVFLIAIFTLTHGLLYAQTVSDSLEPVSLIPNKILENTDVDKASDRNIETLSEKDKTSDINDDSVEIKKLGEIDHKTKLPRLIAVQSENCKPIVNAWEQEKKEVEPLVSEGTIADGLDVPAAIMGHGILKALKESNGQAIAVSEKEILKNFRESLNIGLNFSYESSACLAACQKMQIQGKLHKNEKVLLLTTSSFHTSLLKSL